MPRWSPMACPMVLAAVLLAGCGSSHDPAARTTGTDAATTAAQTGPASIRARVLKSNELAGFTSAGVSVYATVQRWIGSYDEPAGQAAAEKAMLMQEGFKTGAIENLNGTAADAGLSTVEQFRSPAAARRALAFYVSNQKAPKVQAAEGTYASFKVAGIPGAVGFTLGGATGGANIEFTRGAYRYLVGREGATRTNISGLTSAARHLYQRMGR